MFKTSIGPYIIIRFLKPNIDIIISLKNPISVGIYWNISIWSLMTEHGLLESMLESILLETLQFRKLIVKKNLQYSYCSIFCCKDFVLKMKYYFIQSNVFIWRLEAAEAFFKSFSLGFLVWFFYFSVNWVFHRYNTLFSF